MTESGSGYAQGYLALFAHDLEETLVAVDAGDIEAKATLEKAAELDAGNLVDREKRLFLLGWRNGVKASWDYLKEAYRQADEKGLQGDERLNFIAGIWLIDEGQ